MLFICRLGNCVVYCSGGVHSLRHQTGLYADPFNLLPLPISQKRAPLTPPNTSLLSSMKDTKNRFILLLLSINMLVKSDARPLYSIMPTCNAKIVLNDKVLQKSCEVEYI